MKPKPGLYLVDDSGDREKLTLIEGSVRVVQADGQTISLWMTFDKDGLQVNTPYRFAFEPWGQTSAVLKAVKVPGT